MTLNNPHVYRRQLGILRKAGITWKALGPRDARHLHTKTQNRDMTLEFDARHGRAVLCRVSAAALIRVPSQGIEYHEIKRVLYDAHGRKIDERENEKPWTATETRQIGEEIKQALIRGLGEELNLHISHAQLKFWWMEGGHEFPMHPSTEYHGLWSYVMLQRFILDLDELPWPDEVKEVTEEDVLETKRINVIKRVPLDEKVETTFPMVVARLHSF